MTYTPASGWSAQRKIESTTAPTSAPPLIAMDGSGNAVVAWLQTSATNRYDLGACRHSSTSGWGTPVLVETDDVGTVSTPVFVMDPSGFATLLWYQSLHPGERVQPLLQSDELVRGVGHKNGSPKP